MQIKERFQNSKFHKVALMTMFLVPMLVIAGMILAFIYLIVWLL